jgi:hypothetical protein
VKRPKLTDNPESHQIMTIGPTQALPCPTVVKIKISCSQWEGSSCTYEWSPILFVWENEFLGFFPCSQSVLIMFPWDSQRSQDVALPIKPQIYPIWFFCPKFNSRVYKLNRWAIEEHICSYIGSAGGGGVQRGASIGECPIFPKKLVVGQWKWPL